MKVAIAKQPIKVPNIAKGIVINNNSISPGFLKRGLPATLHFVI
tara:strand:- start:1363 stop:1494 length:132 start_codon:yes stop_codon:yes gene_type:complete